MGPSRRAVLNSPLKIVTKWYEGIKRIHPVLLMQQKLSSSGVWMQNLKRYDNDISQTKPYEVSVQPISTLLLNTPQSRLRGQNTETVCSGHMFTDSDK
jgi:hypothetical protein